MPNWEKRPVKLLANQRLTMQNCKRGWKLRYSSLPWRQQLRLHQLPLVAVLPADSRTGRRNRELWVGYITANIITDITLTNMLAVLIYRYKSEAFYSWSPFLICLSIMLKFYFQVQHHYGRQTSHLDCGCILVGENLVSETWTLLPASEFLLDLIGCECKSECGERRKCRQSGQVFHEMYTHCRGEKCGNECVINREDAINRFI